MAARVGTLKTKKPTVEVRNGQGAVAALLGHSSWIPWLGRDPAWFKAVEVRLPPGRDLENVTRETKSQRRRARLPASAASVTFDRMLCWPVIQVFHPVLDKNVQQLHGEALSTGAVQTRDD